MEVFKTTIAGAAFGVFAWVLACVASSVFTDGLWMRAHSFVFSNWAMGAGAIIGLVFAGAEYAHKKE